jgi:23S rRNA (pseudouridine1915-N3)-methyltransferase
VKLRVVAVGAVKERAARALVDDYLGRLKRYSPIEEVELKPGKTEAAALARAVAGTTVVALDVAGAALASEAFARKVEQWASRGKGVVSFVIGGADGLPRDLLASADARVSLSAMTLPHRLARLVLVEQLYRAMTILRGEPYNH